MSGLEPRPDTMIQNPDKTILYPGPRQVQLPQNGSGTLRSLQQAASLSIPATARVQGSHTSRGDTLTDQASEAPGTTFLLGATNT